MCIFSIVCLPNEHTILNTLKIKLTFQSVPGRIFLFWWIEQGVFWVTQKAASNSPHLGLAVNNHPPNSGDSGKTRLYNHILAPILGLSRIETIYLYYMLIKWANNERLKYIESCFSWTKVNRQMVGWTIRKRYLNRV